MRAGGSGIVGRWSVRAEAGCLASSRAGHSYEMMRNGGAEGVRCFRCPMIAVFLSFLFFPIFHRPISSVLLGLLACVSRVGSDKLRGLCGVPCSRLIARVGGWYSVSRAL